MNVLLYTALSAALFAQDEAPDTELGTEADDTAEQVPDRSTPPAVQPPVVLALPEMSSEEIRPGVTVRHMQVPGVRKVHVQVLFHQGSSGLCGADKPACTMLSQIWDVASEETDAAALEASLDQLDGGVVSWVSRHDSGFELTIPRDSLDDGLALMDEVLNTPAFSKSDFKLSRNNLLDWYQYQATSDLRNVSRAAMNHAWYPPEHPLGSRPDLDGLAALKHKSLHALHETLLTEVPITILVFGDLTWDELRDDVLAITEGIGAPGEHDEPPAFTPPSQSHIVAVNMPGQPQAAIRMLTAGPERASEDRVAMSTVNFALGGSFTSRLNGNLREEKGWTYGAYSSFMSGKTHGTWTASVDVEAENVAATIVEIQAEIAEIVDGGATGEEINSAWLDMVTWWNRRLETDSSAANFYQSLERKPESAADVAARLAAQQALTPEQTQAAAARWLGADAPRLWVIVGDRDAIGEQVDQIGLPVTWLTAEQAILGDFSIPR
jgi:zinc protease